MHALQLNDGSKLRVGLITALIDQAVKAVPKAASAI